METPPSIPPVVCDGHNIALSDLKLALFYENSDFGMSTGIGFKETAAKYGLKIVVDESYSKIIPDTTPMVLKARTPVPTS